MDLTNTEYYQDKIDSLNVTAGALKEKSFEECEFVNCSLVDCEIRLCRFLTCTFTNCVFSAIQPINSRFIDSQFKKSKVLSFDWSHADEVRGLSFDNCQLDYSNFRMLKLPKIKMVKCSAKGADFQEAELIEGDFTGTDFEEATFLRTDLSKADFRGAQNYVIDPKSNKLKKTHFSYPDVMGLLHSLDIVID